ncbi:MAG: hypothetical protein IJR59_01310 [Firmicutes bacterium]|nr:hypothetical protein [Bacillota bacterium]
MKHFKFGILAALIAAVLTGCTPERTIETQPQLEVVSAPADNTNISEFETALPETEEETVFEEQPENGEETTEELPEKTPKEAAYTQEYYFRNKKTRDSHFEKHGAEFGNAYKTAEEYETGADKAAHDPNALHKLEKEDNDDVYYVEATNEFVIVSADGYIRTYFKPSAGKKYFDRQ